MDKVYLLSTYGEDGSENMVGTTDKNKVIQLLKDNFKRIDEDKIQKLTSLLNDDLLTDVYPDNLCNGWGGVQLHIIKLQ